MTTCPSCGHEWSPKKVGKTEQSSNMLALIDFIQRLHVCHVGTKPTWDSQITRDLKRLIATHGYNECAERFLRAYEQRIPAFLWRSSPPSLATLIRQFDSLVPWSGGKASMKDVLES